MAEPPRYLIAVCEGRTCRPLASPDDVPPTEAEAIAFLALVAARLRAQGAVGWAVVLDGRAKRVVARRRVWP